MMIFLAALLPIFIIIFRIKIYISSKLEESFQPDAWKYVYTHPRMASFLNLYPISDEIQLLITARFPFYQYLADDYKMFFNFRLYQMTKSFDFVSADSQIEIDFAQKVILLVQANRLTMGFKQYQYRAFTIIEVHPDVYYSEMTHHWHKGDTTTDGVIRLSTKHLNEGDQLPTDGINLAIHEFAHAVMLELFIGDEREDFKTHYFQYKNCVQQNMDLCKEKEIFRSYAYNNDQEFFAVASEVFFETPMRIKDDVPELYQALCNLYNQQPDQANPAVSV